MKVVVIGAIEIDKYEIGTKGRFDSGRLGRAGWSIRKGKLEFQNKRARRLAGPRMSGLLRKAWNCFTGKLN